MQRQQWQGPLPHPDQLARFDEVIPGCAERIVKMAELEGEHSREVQMRAVRGAVRSQHIGQVCAFILAAGAIAGAIYLALNDHDAVAGVLVGGTLGTIVLAFLSSKKS